MSQLPDADSDLESSLTQIVGVAEVLMDWASKTK
jgi:hypothetical protein